MALHSRAKTKVYHYARKLVRPKVLATLALLSVVLPVLFYIVYDDALGMRSNSCANQRMLSTRTRR
jgi:hypothetical protein